MKILLLFLFPCVLMAQTKFDNVRVSGTLIAGSSIAISSKAVVEMVSTTKGFLPPRMSTTQRDAISSPGEGNTIFNITTHRIDSYNGSSWVPIATTSDISGTSQLMELLNVGLSASVGSSTLTIALKQSDGTTDPSTGTAAAKIGYRSATLTSGAYSEVSTTASLSMSVSNGSTLGHTSANQHPVYIYGINNAGSTELAVSCKYFGKSGIVSTTAEGGAGAADTSTVMYSTTARSSVPFRLIGRLLMTETNAGVWASAPTQVDVWPFIRTNSNGMYSRASSDQTITAGAGATAIVFNTAVETADNIFYDTSTGLIRVKEPMVIKVTGDLTALTGGTTGAEVFIYKNGTAGTLYKYSDFTTSKTGVATAIVSMVPGDTLGVYLSASGTNVTVQNSNGRINSINFNSVNYFD